MMNSVCLFLPDIISFIDELDSLILSIEKMLLKIRSSDRLGVLRYHNAISRMRLNVNAISKGMDQIAQFKLQFTSLCPDYLPALHRLNPKLTNTDDLIAMLVLLDLSSDEMALVLGISKRGLNKARYRMRKRLNLKKGDNLNEFLKQIVA